MLVVCLLNTTIIGHCHAVAVAVSTTTAYVRENNATNEALLKIIHNLVS